MKTIGLLGGMSWESTASYYRLLNEGVKARLGGFHSARLCLYSVDFHEIEQYMSSGRWAEAAGALSRAAAAVEAGGADFFLICTNTLHKVAPDVEASVSIPLLHIADATAEAVKAAGHRTVGLLGTRFTMEEDFYARRLEDRHGLTVRVPEPADREVVHRVVFEELCQGRIEASSREEYLRIIGKLSADGAEAVILGCTEIALLVSPEHAILPLFDTTRIHAEKAVEVALG
jgi:aspartate racemase